MGYFTLKIKNLNRIVSTQGLIFKQPKEINVRDRNHEN